MFGSTTNWSQPVLTNVNEPVWYTSFHLGASCRERPTQEKGINTP